MERPDFIKHYSEITAATHAFQATKNISAVKELLGQLPPAGTGIERIRNSIQKAGLPHPVFESNLFFSITFPVPVEKHGTSELRDHVGIMSGPSGDQVAVLKFCKTPRPLVAITKRLKRSSRAKVRENVLNPLTQAGLLAMTIGDKPKSRLQQYVTTDAGKKQINKRR